MPYMRYSRKVGNRERVEIEDRHLCLLALHTVSDWLSTFSLPIQGEDNKLGIFKNVHSDFNSPKLRSTKRSMIN
jgi:hypothetical protein